MKKIGKVSSIVLLPICMIFVLGMLILFILLLLFKRRKKEEETESLN